MPTADYHKHMSEVAEVELRRMLREKTEQVQRLESEIRRLKTEAKKREAKPSIVPAIRVGGGR